MSDITGKKINELEESINITDDTVIPGVVVESGVTASTATKISINTLKKTFQNGIQFEQNIVIDLESANIELSKIVENTVYQYGALTSLKINDFSKSYQESTIYFSSGDTPTELTFTKKPIWINEEPKIEANKDYIISICNGMAIIGSSTSENIDSDDNNTENDKDPYDETNYPIDDSIVSLYTSKLESHQALFTAVYNKVRIYLWNSNFYDDPQTTNASDISVYQGEPNSFSSVSNGMLGHLECYDDDSKNNPTQYTGTPLIYRYRDNNEDSTLYSKLPKAKFLTWKA